MKNLRVAIVGLGAIGAGYSALDKQKIQNHAAAYIHCAGYELLAAVDTSQASQATFSRHYPGIATFSSLNELDHDLNIDVFSVCVPTEAHLSVCRDILQNFSPKAILLEKPVTENLRDAEALATICREKGVLVAVNYMRRFEPGLVQLRKLVQSGELGELLSGSAWYQRGMLHNASHFVDYFSFLFGEATAFAPPCEGASPEQQSTVEQVPALSTRTAQTRSWRIAWNSAEIAFFEVNDAEFNFFEARLIFSHAVVDLLSGGAQVSYRRCTSRSDFSGRSSLATATLVPGSDMDRYQYYVQEALYHAVCSDLPLASTLDTAIQSTRVLWALNGCPDAIAYFATRGGSHE